MQEDALLGLIALAGLVCLVFGAFFAFRGIYRFRAWQAGEKDELWTFLSMVLGCGSLILCGITIVVMLVGMLSETIPEWALGPASGVTFIGLLLGLGAIGLTTFYYFLKWRPTK